MPSDDRRRVLSRGERTARAGLLLGELGRPLKRLQITEVGLRLELEHENLAHGRTQIEVRYPVEDLRLDDVAIRAGLGERLDLGRAPVAAPQDHAAEDARQLLDHHFELV